MLKPLTNTFQTLLEYTWPMIIISIIILVSFRIAFLIKTKGSFSLYKELFTLLFIIYILALFQIVTFQDDVTWSTNNFVPFKEIFRYKFNSILFFKNVLGNMIMFVPFGFFVSSYLKNDKLPLTLFLTIIASFSIEVVQLCIGRVFDVDNIILNVCGGIIGHYIYIILSKITNLLPKIFKNELFLNIISGIFIIIVLIRIITLI